MKKILILTLILGISFQFTSCKTEKKKEVEAKKEVKVHPYSLKTAKNSIDWVAYKTTDKLPVKGKFKKITITKNGEGNTTKEAINGAEFSIPVSSLFTADVSRDFKLKKFFFGFMDNTKLLSGKLTLTDDTNGIASITMNGITADLPFTYTLEGKEFKLTSTMNLDNWNAQKAVESLNVACKDLHKATDGVSKTWSEVAINITSVFQ
ncbi:MAG: YceI family protein [Flavobacteriaceae bacterium]|nr:YceI family protein [Flavobacteriaceae bacterium]